MSLPLAFLRIGIQDALQYRAESFIWILCDIGPPIMMLFVWTAAYGGQTDVAGFDLPTMLTYTIGVLLLRNAVTSHVEWDVDEAIRMGTLSGHLAKPYHVWLRWLCTTLASRVFRTAVTAPVALLAWLFTTPSTVTLGLASAERVLATSISVALAITLSFLVKLIIGLCAFWISDIHGLHLVEEILSYSFGGMLVPIELLPTILTPVANVLPFRALYHVPMSIALGRTEGAEAWLAVGFQLVWLGVLLLVARFLWRRGLLTYEAVGG
ncbi:MAG: ABC-2 family transporter protein [Chloroflexota bacterium]